MAWGFGFMVGMFVGICLTAETLYHEFSRLGRRISAVEDEVFGPPFGDLIDEEAELFFGKDES